MTRGPAAAPPKGLRRLERWFVGLVMAMVAFVLEKAALRAVRRKGEVAPEPEPTTLTARGGKVDLPD